MFDKPNGAFTGEISAEQLKDCKVGWALCGHSERRVVLKEQDDVRAPISRASKKVAGWTKEMECPREQNVGVLRKTSADGCSEIVCCKQDESSTRWRPGGHIVLWRNT